MYKYVSKDFGASPSQMGAITVCRGLTQALTSPIGGVLGTMMNRVRVILYGCLLWATMTWLFGISRWAPNPFVMGAIVWALNGLGLSLVIPNSNSIIADYYSPESRGRAFGLLMLNGGVGAVLGSLFATNMAGWNSDTIHGWQIVMFVLAVMSGVIGWVNFKIAQDPRDVRFTIEPEQGTNEEQQFLRNVESEKGRSDLSRETTQTSWTDIQTAIKAVFRIPTFRIIILQGVVGSMPWKALGSFTTLYLQLIGMSNFQAALVYCVFLIGAAVGAWIGGFVGDKASLMAPQHGRIFACQFSVFTGIPLTLFVFKGLPRNGDMATMCTYAAVFGITGLLISWAAPCCNSPIFAEIVHPSYRTIIYAFDRCLEDALASPVSFLVGLAAEQVWGFTGEATSSGDHEKDLDKADALGKALMWFSVVPWTLCLLFYSALHFTYAKDKKDQHVATDD